MKARNRKTGEIVDIISYSSYDKERINILDYVSYIDSKGIEHPNVRGLNLYWDFETINEEANIKSIDWEQRRYEIAKSATLGACNEYDCLPLDNINQHNIVISAVNLADALIKQLKKNE